MAAEYAEFWLGVPPLETTGGFAFKAVLSILNYSALENLKLETGRVQLTQSFLQQPSPPANGVALWTGFCTNPLFYFCNALIILSTHCLLLFLLNCAVAFALPSLALPSISLPHLAFPLGGILATIKEYIFRPVIASVITISTWALWVVETFIFFIYFFGYKNLPEYRPGESLTLRVVTSLLMIPLWIIMIMGGFLAFGIGAWGLLAGRWLAKFGPIRKVHEWIELRSVDELERGWEGRSRSFMGMGSPEEPMRLAYSGVMVVAAQEPALSSGEATPRLLPPPPSSPLLQTIVEPSSEVIQEIREGFRRIREIRERMTGGMMKMKAEIDKMGGELEKQKQTQAQTQQAQSLQRYRSAANPRHSQPLHRMKVKV